MSGYTGRFIPEELICAAGAEPYLICRGGEPEPPDASFFRGSYLCKKEYLIVYEADQLAICLLLKIIEVQNN